MRDKNIGMLTQELLQAVNELLVCPTVRAAGITDDPTKPCNHEPVDTLVPAVEVVPVSNRGSCWM